MQFGTFVLLVVIVVVFFLLFVSAGARNRRGAPPPRRPCPQCGSVHPDFASFCRRCGKRLA